MQVGAPCCKTSVRRLIPPDPTSASLPMLLLQGAQQRSFGLSLIERESVIPPKGIRIVWLMRVDTVVQASEHITDRRCARWGVCNREAAVL